MGKENCLICGLKVQYVEGSCPLASGYVHVLDEKGAQEKISDGHFVVLRSDLELTPSLQDEPQQITRNEKVYPPPEAMPKSYEGRKCVCGEINCRERMLFV